MANEELIQRRYLESGKLVGATLGIFEHFSLGATHAKELVSCGLDATIPLSVDFPFSEYAATKNPERSKPDQLYAIREGGQLHPVAVVENKRPSDLKSSKQETKAAEQVLFAAAALGVRIGYYTDGTKCVYVDIEKSLLDKKLTYFKETRTFNPAVLQNLLAGDTTLVRDPQPLAESVWQIIWHATKAEPKECLLTFVEMFVLKFLSDNLPTTRLPQSHTFYELTSDPQAFQCKHGKTAIEYYIETIRPKIKSLFPDNTVADHPGVASIFGLSTVVSKTSIINGFAFLRSSTTSLTTFDRTFREILDAFQAFGPLTEIDPQFKLRLYETFLRRSARQQKLGQFFTPRNVVQSMIRMANLQALPDGAVVLDPAAGVGGFVLEPMLFSWALKDNIKFVAGRPQFRVLTVGVDVDADVHILAKANMLIHLAETLRGTSTTLPAINLAMADTFVQMHENETLGALLNPPINSVDVILTNPPYVTNGSAIYGKELLSLKNVIRNEVDLRDHYAGCGLGVEALFLRYISAALKPGGKGFVIVPLGMLNRTEPGPKQRLLDDCNILASIALPRNTFFNTAQKTYILVLEKRHTTADIRPSVLCGIARSIGETLDYKRIPTPEDNDLGDIAEVFLKVISGDTSAQVELNKLTTVKLVDADEFTANDRWDVSRFWTDEELVKLGERSQPIEKDEFIEQAENTMRDLLDELTNARTELQNLSSCSKTTIPFSDATKVIIRPGARIRDVDIRNNPGTIPVYSCFKNASIRKGLISAAWLTAQGIAREHGAVVTVNANGVSVGRVFLRHEDCVLTDDVIAIQPVDSGIVPAYLAVELRKVVATGGFIYEAKLFQKRVRELVVEIPITPDGDFDMPQQEKIAAAVKRFDTLVSKLRELGSWAGDARIA